MGRHYNLLLTENSCRSMCILRSHRCQTHLYVHTCEYREIGENAHQNADSNHLWGVGQVAGVHGRREIFNSFLMFCVVLCIFFSKQLLSVQELPRWLIGKEPTCKAGDTGSIPESGRSPGVGNGNLPQYACLEDSMDRGAWRSTARGVAKSQRRRRNWAHTHTAYVVCANVWKPSNEVEWFILNHESQGHTDYFTYMLTLCSY